MQKLPLTEKKLLYRVLHQNLTEFPELMDSEFLHDLQRDLQKLAQADGVDVAHHGDWDAWLGNQPVSCETRMKGRRVIGKPG